MRRIPKEFWLLFFGLSGGLACLAAYLFIQFTRPGDLTEPVSMVLARGSGLSATASVLAERGVVSSALAFKLGAVISGKYKQIKAGEYSFPAHISAKDVLEMLSKGQVVVRQLTIAEGLRTADIITLIKNAPMLSGEIPASIPEGSLLPESYHYMRGDSRAGLVKRMQDAMQKTVSILWEKREAGLPLTSIQEAVVLASIVERETGIASERPHVASVFINRLKQGIKLQSDPTTLYAIESKEGRLNRPLTLNDLQLNLPHNTYVIDGLPPTPICNPGRASLEAVLHPAHTDDLYFVATGTGGHVFSATLEQHNINVRKYRQVMAKQK